VAAVEDDGEEGPLRDGGAGGGEVVVGERVIPVEVVGQRISSSRSVVSSPFLSGTWEPWPE